jgi:hypothetical protein
LKVTIPKSKRWNLEGEVLLVRGSQIFLKLTIFST